MAGPIQQRADGVELIGGRPETAARRLSASPRRLSASRDVVIRRSLDSLGRLS